MKPPPCPPPSAPDESEGLAPAEDAPVASDERWLPPLGRILARRWLLERDGLPPGPPDDPGADRSS